jgi:hypothetical protein
MARKVEQRRIIAKVQSAFSLGRAIELSQREVRELYPMLHEAEQWRKAEELAAEVEAEQKRR